MTEKAIVDAMRDITFHGRMEKMQESPLVLIDGAHNPQKMRAAAQALQDIYPNKRKTLVIGMIQGKDVKKTLQEILPLVDKVIVTGQKILGKPSLLPPEMASIVKEIKPDMQIREVEDIRNAVQDAMFSCGPDDLVFVSGSIYMLGPVRNMWYPAEDILKKLEYP